MDNLRIGSKERYLQKLHSGAFNNKVDGAIKWSLGKKIDELSNPKISFAYFCYNMIKQRGEKWVRDSFDVMKGQSNDIMVIDYDSEDNIKQLAKEYRFRYFNVPKEEGIPYHMAKCTNLAIHKAKHDIFVRLCPDIIYPQNFSWYISSFFSVNSPKRMFLFFKLFDLREDGKVIGRPGWEMTFYRPYLLLARGWDERTTYYVGEDAYGRWIMEKVFRCEKYTPPYYFLAHRHHTHKNVNKINPNQAEKVLGKILINKQISLLSANVFENRKLVKNSYW